MSPADDEEPTERAYFGKGSLSGEEAELVLGIGDVANLPMLI